MLFNSFEYMFLFLPIVVIMYFYLNYKRLTDLAKFWLVCSSLFFYSWWNVLYLPLILFSLVINFMLGKIFNSNITKINRKQVLIIGILFNVVLLGYYKYADFFIHNTNALFATNFSLLELALPLAISFFTFQQIAFLVDTYKREVRGSNFLDYALFVTFFPQLIAGPIVHHKEMMPQFSNIRKKVVNYKNMCLGLFFFSIGLFKKVILADSFSVWVTQGYDQIDMVTLIEGWIISLSFTFQIYFDFSGYMDMAIGAALLFNIKLPTNFNSPYKATNIQDGWEKWHMTLSRFLYKYIYIPLNKLLLRSVFTPLGFKKKTALRTDISLLLLFLISGIWHGAGWTFIFWGFMHGVATVTHRHWKNTNIKMNRFLAWFLYFNYINLTMVFFRAETFQDALKILKGMFGFNGIIIPETLRFLHLSIGDYITIGSLTLNNSRESVLYLMFGFIIILMCKNTVQLAEKFKPSMWVLLYSLILLVYSILNLTKDSEFIYFNF